VPVAGPFSAAERLSPTLPAAGDVFDYDFSSDSTRAIFLADSAIDEQRELWSTPAAGPASAAVHLNLALVAGGDVISTVTDVGGFVIYRADALVDERIEAWRVPLAGPAAAGVRLHGAPPAGGDVLSAGELVGPEGPVEILLGDLRLDETFEIYSAAPDGGGAPHPLFASPPAGSQFLEAGGLGFDAESAALYFSADGATLGKFELWRATVDAGGTSGPPLRLSAMATPASTDVAEVWLSPDGARVVYLTDPGVDERFELWRVRSDGSSSPVRLHPAPVAGGDVRFGTMQWTPEGRGVVYLADAQVDERIDLWIADGMIFRADFAAGDLAEWSATVP